MMGRPKLFTDPDTEEEEAPDNRNPATGLMFSRRRLPKKKKKAVNQDPITTLMTATPFMPGSILGPRPSINAPGLAFRQRAMSPFAGGRS